MKKRLFFIMIGVFLIVAGIAPVAENVPPAVSSGTAWASQNCPSCGGSMYFTGQTKTEWGRLFRLYRCPVGHSWWIRQQSSIRGFGHSMTQLKCPVCGAGVYFTGETFMEWGKLYKVYRCPAGHRSVGQ